MTEVIERFLAGSAFFMAVSSNASQPQKKGGPKPSPECGGFDQ
jgi:hypothetical protein